MSIKLMSQVWEKQLGHSAQSILLAMADYADDDGRNCYPSHERLAWKTGYSTRQVSRIIQELCADGILVILKPSNQHQSTQYWLRLSEAADKAPFRVDISDTPDESSMDNMSSLQANDDSSIDTMSTLNENSIDKLSSLDSQGGHLEHPGWTNETSRVDMVSGDPSVNHQLEPTEEKEIRTRDPLQVAWQQAYADVEMPPKLAASLKELAAECSIAAAIHGIKASASNPDGRNFKYIAECARNYVPPARGTGKAEYGSTYAVDLPGVVALEPAAAAPAPTFAPPMAHDDPWAIVLPELRRVLPGSAPHWLENSRLEANGELAGVPFYRVVMTTPGADAEWMMRQVEPAVRRKVSSVLGKRISIEFVAMHEMEMVPA